MKKQLLVGAIMLASFFTAQAQTQSHDFNDLTVGNVGTVLDGSAPGQGGWFTLASNGDAGTTTTNMDNTAHQIVAGDAAHGNVLSITGPNGNAGFASAAQLPGQFYNDAYQAGNGILSVKFDYYTGTADATTKNFFNVTSYGIEGTGQNAVFYALGGFGLDPATLEVYGQANLDANGEQPAGNYYLFLSETPGQTVTLPENTWVTLAYSYNPQDGNLEFMGSSNGEVLFAVTFTGASENADLFIPSQVEFTATNGAAGNTASVVRQFDNVSFIANTTGILSTKPVQAIAEFSVYPNPANDLVNISNVDALVNNVSVVDLNGRTVKNVNFAGVNNAQVNVSDLSAGVYMMTVSSDKGSITKKIVKN